MTIELPVSSLSNDLGKSLDDLYNNIANELGSSKVELALVDKFKYASWFEVYFNIFISYQLVAFQEPRPGLSCQRRCAGFHGQEDCCFESRIDQETIGRENW